MDEAQRRVDEIRKERSELENHLIDEYVDGKITRREFVRRGTVVGMSIPLVSFIAAACGGVGGTGTTLTANDIKTTFETLVNPKNASNALSALGGVLSPGNTEAPDDATVVFHLDAPNGNFPTLVSSANYNAIIIPASLDPADWGKTFDGTGPFKLEKFTPKVGASFVRYDGYWGDKANPDRMELKFYDGEAPMVNA